MKRVLGDPEAVEKAAAGRGASEVLDRKV